jgi:hypothetical protein
MIDVTYECGCEAGGALVSAHCPMHGDRILTKIETMTPENRAEFERITALRDKIGLIDIDVVAELREERGYEDTPIHPGAVRPGVGDQECKTQSPETP